MARSCREFERGSCERGATCGRAEDPRMQIGYFCMQVGTLGGTSDGTRSRTRHRAAQRCSPTRFTIYRMSSSGNAWKRVSLPISDNRVYTFTKRHSSMHTANVSEGVHLHTTDWQHVQHPSGYLRFMCGIIITQSAHGTPHVRTCCTSHSVGG